MPQMICVLAWFVYIQMQAQINYYHFILQFRTFLHEIKSEAVVELLYDLKAEPKIFAKLFSI